MARGSEPFQRTEGGPWWVVVDIPPDPATGKRRQRWLKARTKKLAYAAARGLLTTIDRGEWVEESHQTLADYLAVWMDSKHDWRDSTRRNRQTIARKHVAPTIGRLRLSRITPLEVQRWLDGLRASGLSDGRLREIRGLLSAALSQAVRWQLIARNPCDAVDQPRYRPPERPVWDDATARAWLAETADTDDGPLWALAAYTGMRRGELLGLHWEDVDLGRRVARVRYTLSQTAGGYVLAPPKTGRERDVPLRRPAIEALREQRRRQNARRLRLGAAWSDTGLVFDRGDGEKINADVASNRWIRSVRRRGYPEIRFHDLRHTAASLMRAAGMPELEIQIILGHTTFDMTRRYLHVSVEQLRESIDRMDA